MKKQEKIECLVAKIGKNYYLTDLRGVKITSLYSCNAISRVKDDDNILNNRHPSFECRTVTVPGLRAGTGLLVPAFGPWNIHQTLETKDGGAADEGVGTDRYPVLVTGANKSGKTIQFCSVKYKAVGGPYRFGDTVNYEYDDAPESRTNPREAKWSAKAGTWVWMRTSHICLGGFRAYQDPSF